MMKGLKVTGRVLVVAGWAGVAGCQAWILYWTLVLHSPTAMGQLELLLPIFGICVSWLAFVLGVVLWVSAAMLKRRAYQGKEQVECRTTVLTDMTRAIASLSPGRAFVFATFPMALPLIGIIPYALWLLMLQREGHRAGGVTPRRYWYYFVGGACLFGFLYLTISHDAYVESAILANGVVLGFTYILAPPVAATLRSAELSKPVAFFESFMTLLKIWCFPIGIWSIQKRIHRIALPNQAL